jgi:hypothetical protein
MSRTIVCSFSSGLDELKRNQQSDHVLVLAMLKAAGRFSAFEASANQFIAGTITDLFHAPKVVQYRNDMRFEYDGPMLEAIGGSYPWTKVRLTAAGEQLLKDQKP